MVFVPSLVVEGGSGFLTLFLSITLVSSPREPFRAPLAAIPAGIIMLAVAGSVER